LSSKNLSTSKIYNYISNEELKEKIDLEEKDFIILDAREDIEVEVGYMP
jgi:predicted sulfurtransferase